MKKIYALLAALICLAVFTGGVSAAGEGWATLEVSTNVNGAYVEVYDISGTMAYSGYAYSSVAFDVHTDGTPLSRVVTSASGYYTDATSISTPYSGEYKTVYVTLSPVNPSPQPVGGDTGYIQVYSNVNGALVKLIDGSGNVVQTGYISNGQATFTVYTTGTPIRTVEVSASGCTTETSSVSMPSADGTSTVTVDLSMIPVPSPSPLPVFGLIAGLCAAVYLLRR